MNYTCNSKACPKGGVKIHEGYTSSAPDNRTYPNNEPNLFKPSQLKKAVNFHTTTIDSLDLDIEHYSLQDIYKLFNINDNDLTEDCMKNAKQIVLKMHPDKSKLDSKYFLFFSKAYKLLHGVYEFQNKSIKKQNKQEDFFNESNKVILDNMFEKNKDFKDPKNFNQWFNTSFEKHRTETPNEQGYGDWLKSDEGFINVNETVTKGNMNDIIEQKKKQVQALTVYTGISDMQSSMLGASLLDGSGDFSTEEYTDLRQAYTQTLIPVTNEDWEKTQKFNNVNEYKSHRDKVDITPITPSEANRKLHQQSREANQQSAALAFKYAKEAEKVKKNQQGFWSELKQITGW